MLKQKFTSECLRSKSVLPLYKSKKSNILIKMSVLKVYDVFHLSFLSLRETRFVVCDTVSVIEFFTTDL